MTNIEFISLVASIVSVVLAVLAIWLALYHKKQSDNINEHVRGLLTEVRSDAKVVTTYALPELQKYSDAMVDHVFYGKNTSISGKEPLAGRISAERDEVQVNSVPEVSATDLIAEFQTQVETIHQGSGFKATDRDNALRLARKIKASNLEEDPEFRISLEHLMDSFAAADQNLFIDALDDLFSEVTIATPEINQTMVTSLGRRMLETDQPAQELSRRFRRHFAAAVQNDLLQYALPWQIIDAYSRGDTDELRNSLALLKEQDEVTRLSALDLFSKLKSTSKLAKRTTPKIRKVAQKAASFLDSDFAEELGLGYETDA